jgi:hypothetical protein
MRSYQKISDERNYFLLSMVSAGKAIKLKISLSLEISIRTYRGSISSILRLVAAWVCTPLETKSWYLLNNISPITSIIAYRFIGNDKIEFEDQNIILYHCTTPFNFRLSILNS